MIFEHRNIFRLLFELEFYSFQFKENNKKKYIMIVNLYTARL